MMKYYTPEQATRMLGINDKRHIAYAITKALCNPGCEECVGCPILGTIGISGERVARCSYMSSRYDEIIMMFPRLTAEKQAFVNKYIVAFDICVRCSSVVL